jgi:hypothetical protein
MFQKIGKAVTSRIQSTKGALTSFTQCPLLNLSIIGTTLSILLAIALSVYLFIAFAITGGYSQQIGLIQSGQFGSAFSAGVAASYFGNPLLMAAGILLALAFMVAVIWAIANSTTGKRTAIILLLAGLIIVFVLPLVFFLFVLPYLYSTVDSYDSPFLPLVRLGIDVISSFQGGSPIPFVIYFAVALALAVALFVLLWRTEAQSAFKSVILSMVGILAVIPVTLLLLENVIPLALAAIIGIIVFFVARLFLSGSGSASSSGAGTSSDRPKAATSAVHKTPKEKLKTVPNNQRLRRSKGVMEEYIEKSEINGTWGWRVCSQGEFDRGEVIIVDENGRKRNVPS